MRRLWRVENSEGIGPYRAGEAIWSQLPDCDSVTRRHPNHGATLTEATFAFESKRQLLDWFDVNELKTLISLGFRVVSWLEDERNIIPGNKQVAVVKVA